MGTTLHKDLTGIDLHVAKLHADTHVAAGTDPLTLAESQVTDLTSDLASKVDEGDARLIDARTPTAHTQTESTIVDLVTDLAGKALTVHTHTKSQITDFPVIPDYQALGTAALKDVPASGDATVDQVVKGDDTRLSDARVASDVVAWAKEATKPAYTPGEIGAEAVANKSTSVPTDAASDVKYPSVKAVKDYADGLVAGLLNYRGGYDASVNTYPATGGSGTAGAVMKGDMWAVSFAGTLGGVSIQGGDVIIAKINTPAQTAGNWNALNTNISYVPEDQANKENTTLDTSTTKYPTNNLVKTGLDGKLPLAGGTMSGDLTLGENTAVALDPAGSVDEKWSGITVTGTAGIALAVGDLCYLNSAFKWVLTDANAAETAGCVALGLCILAAAGDTSATRMLLMGTMRSAAFPASITGGAQLYVHTTAGDMTTTQPAGINDVVRVVGWAILTEPNTIYFNPSSQYRLLQNGSFLLETF